MLTPPTRFLPAALALVSLAAPGVGQQSDAQLRDEIDFARGLATRWGFVDMAERVLERVDRAQGAGASIGEEAALARAEVYYASGVASSARRDELFAKAVEAYETFVSRNPYSERKAHAEAEIVRISAASARSMSLKLEDSTGEEAIALRGRIAEVLKRAVDRIETLIADMEKLPDEERGKTRYLDLLLQRADLRLEQARLGEKEPFLKWSNDGYESLIAVAEEGSPYQLRGFIGIGDVKVEEGNFGEAADFYEYVVESAVPREVPDWGKDLSSPDEANKRFLFMQMAIPGLVSSLQKAGKQNASVEWGLHFYNTWKSPLTIAGGSGGKASQMSLSPHDLFGPLAQLALARTLIDAGGFLVSEGGRLRWVATLEEAGGQRGRNLRTGLDLALSIAQQVNAENKGNTMQVRAQKVISEVISRPGIEVAPEVLFEAALGDFNDRAYAEALTDFRRVLAALERADQAKRTEIGSKVMWHIGRSLQQLGRPLEAAMAFDTGLTRWAGDPEYDKLNAKRFLETANALRRQMRDDPVIEALVRNAELQASKFQENVAGDLQMREAVALYEQKKYQEAQSRYRQVPAGTDTFEEAMVFVGVCDYFLGNHAAAQKVFQDYLDTYVKDPTNSLQKAAQIASRQKASAAATYYWGRSALDQKDHQRAVQLFDGFHVRFPGQDLLAASALSYLLEAYTKLEDHKAALETFELLVKTYPDSPATAVAAFTTYRQLKERHERETDPAKKLALLRQMAENLQVGNRNVAKPSLVNLRNEAAHWVDLAVAAAADPANKSQAAELWATAEAVLKRIRSSFDAQQTDVVLPALGRALLAQYKVQEAAEILAPVAEARAGREATYDYTRALTGWMEFQGGANGQPQIVQVPGVGTAEAYAKAHELLQKLQASAKNNDPWGPEEYRYRAATMYALYQWGQIDGKKLTEAKDMMKLLVANVGERFDDADKKPEGDTLQTLLWLKEKLK